jgi:hypothetical protein
MNNFLDTPGPATAQQALQVQRAPQSGRRRPISWVADSSRSAPLSAAAVAANRTLPDAGRPGTAGENVSQNRPERVADRGERQGERTERRDEVRNQYNENNPGSFWEENPGWTALAITTPFAWADWGSVGSWCGYSGEPTSYAYGEDIYYSGEQVYYGGSRRHEEYAQQAAAIATTEPTAAPEKGEWLPLGVFAITQDGQASGAEPIYAACDQQVSRIAGTLTNTLTGKSQTLSMADKKSQRVA